MENIAPYLHLVNLHMGVMKWMSKLVCRNVALEWVAEETTQEEGLIVKDSWYELSNGDTVVIVKKIFPVKRHQRRSGQVLK
jgi:uncharacterized Zn ribbon protein